MAQITNSTQRASPLPVTTLTSNTANDFNAEELVTLSRAWASVLNIAASNDVTLTGDQLTDLSSDASRLFWLLVRSEYVARSPRSSRLKTAQELQMQWEKIRPSLVKFLHFFTFKWSGLRLLSEDAGTCRQEALGYAAAAFIEKTGSEFKYLMVASKLTYHEKWWSVLSPLLLQENKRINGGTNMREEIEEDSPSQRRSGRGIVRPRSENEEGETSGRRVRRRVDSHSSSSQNVPVATSPSLLEEAEMKKAEVIERQLEMEVMTKSEEGMSVDAMEYLRLQRQLILGKLREKNGVGRLHQDTNSTNGREGGACSATGGEPSGAIMNDTPMSVESNGGTHDGANDDTTTSGAFKASSPYRSRRHSL